MRLESPRVHDLSPGRGLTAWGSFTASLSRVDKLAATGAGALAFLVYLLTLAPSVTAEDSGELISAAFTLGVAHPPGYPLFVLLAKLFLTVFPFGEVAWRVNVLTALLGGVAVSLLVFLARRLSASLPASVSLGLVAGFTSIFWSQATAAEVYTLAAVAFLVVLHLLVLYLLEATPGRLWILSYAFGLSLAAHPSLILMAPRSSSASAGATGGC